MRIFISDGYSNKKTFLLEEVDYDSFKSKDKLCPYIFQPNGQLIKEVRKSLLEAAKDFYNFLQFDWLENGIKDIWLVGSMAGYNWSERYSDIDIHLVMKYSDITENEDLLSNDLWALKTLYNKEHDIEIKGFKVEVYAQNIDEDIKSDGIYSILRQTWIKKPVKREIKINKSKINNFVRNIEKQVEKALEEFRSNNFDVALEMTEDIKENVRELRESGLMEDGEFSSKNLAFKALRRNGTLDKLDRLKTLAFDNEISIDKTKKEKAEAGEINNDTEEKSAKKSKETTPSPKQKGKPDDDKGGYNDGITYSINGIKFPSLRSAEKTLGLPKSTIEYRVNSDLPKWQAFKKITQGNKE